MNADDFGVAAGVNQGIVECHRLGILTSASLMVERAATAEAVALSRENPELGIGLHWDGGGEGKPYVDTDDLNGVQAELDRQLDMFVRLMGRTPTHIDSESHTHREPELMPLFLEASQRLGVPLRGADQVTFEGGFYAQWTYAVTELDRISVDALESLLRSVEEGWTEISCHPGYPTEDHTSIYWTEREVEVRTLTDPRIREVVTELGLQLRSFADFLYPKHVMGERETVTLGEERT